MQYYIELRRSPFIDEVTLDFALEAMKRHDLGRDADTDVLTIGFAATDGIGHQWGPDSHEQMDQMLRLDLLLGRLFDADRLVGRPRQYRHRAVGRSWLAPPRRDHADAGARRAQGCAKADRERGRCRAGEALSGVDLISHFATDIYLNEDAVRRNKLNWEEVEKTAVEAMLSTGFVERVYTREDLSSTAGRPTIHTSSSSGKRSISRAALI